MMQAISGTISKATVTNVAYVKISRTNELLLVSIRYMVSCDPQMVVLSCAIGQRLLAEYFE